MKELNQMIKDFVLVESYPVNMNLMKMIGKGNFIVSARDFVCIDHVTMDSTTGCIEKVSLSVEDSRCPPDSKFVRGEIKISAQRIMPNKNGGCNLVIVSLSDPKGSIPNMIKKSAAKKQGERFETILKTFYKKFGK